MYYSLNIICPMSALVAGFIQPKLCLLIKLAGVHHNPSISTRCNRYPHTHADGDRHNKTLVVIRMLANQVYSTGCAKNSRLSPEALFEFIRQPSPDLPGI